MVLRAWMAALRDTWIKMPLVGVEASLDAAVEPVRGLAAGSLAGKVNVPRLRPVVNTPGSFVS